MTATILPGDPAPPEHVVSCGTCGTRIAWSRFSMQDATDAAWDKGGVFRDDVWWCEHCFEKKVNPRQNVTLTEDWLYVFQPNVDGVFVRIRKARKPHPCSLRGCVIRPGHEYVEQTVAPWVLIADDVDDYGRPVGAANGEWTRTAWHRYGDEHNTDAIPAGA